MKKRKPAAVSLAMVPSLNRERQVALIEVPDPYEPGRTIVVTKNVRAHPADFLHACKRIDDAQRAAANRVRALYERAEIGASKAIDYSAVRVDGGALQEPLAEAVYAARKALLQARRAVGEAGWAIVQPVMGEGIALERVVRDKPHLARGLSGRQAYGYVSGRLREALDDLVAHWGLIATGARRRLVAERELSISGPQAEWEVGRWGELEAVAPRVSAIPPKAKKVRRAAKKKGK